MSSVTMEIIAVAALVLTVVSVVLGVQRMLKKRRNTREAESSGLAAEFCLENPGLVLIAFVFLLGTIVFLVRGELPAMFTALAPFVVGASLTLNYTWRRGK